MSVDAHLSSIDLLALSIHRYEKDQLIDSTGFAKCHEQLPSMSYGS